MQPLISCLSACLPEPAEHISYLLAITVVPITLALWLLASSRLKASCVDNAMLFWINRGLFTTALATQFSLALFVACNLTEQHTVFFKLFLVGSCCLSVTMATAFYFEKIQPFRQFPSSTISFSRQ